VERKLKKHPGITNASVNYTNGTAVVELGTSSIDEAELQTAIRSIGYDLIIDKEEEKKTGEIHLAYYRQLKNNMTGSLILSIPVLIISMFLMNMSTGQSVLPYANLIMLILTLPVLLWFGRSFFINAFRLARHRQANMDTLVALSTGIAFLFSLFNTIFPQFWHSRGLHPHVYYEASSVIISFILIGKVLEEGAKSKTSSAIKKLMGLQPELATLIDSKGTELQIHTALVKPNDLLRIKPGDKIPVDGEIVSGSSAIDESTITGESMPMDKITGDHVYAGTQNLNGSFVLRAIQTGSGTVLARIIQMVQQAQGSKAPVQKTVDKIAGIFVPVVISISIISFIVWMLAGGENALTHALMAMVTVLVIACPCALGLATPTAIMVGMGKGARNGILIKDADSLERFQKVNVMVVDKTGTLTEGKPSVTDMIWLVNGNLKKEYEEILAAMEKQSAHPLANAIVASMPDSLKATVRFDDFENISGKGIKAKVSGKLFLAGNMKFMLEEGLSLSNDELQKVINLQEQSRTVVLFGDKEKPLGIIGLADTLKANSLEAIQQLQQKGTEVLMLTGDNEQTARSIAHLTGITLYRAGMMPSEKADFIKDMQSGGKIVAMVGDGINDSQALAQADVSIAMGKGSDIAMDVAGITIMSSDLKQLPKAMRLSRLTVRTIHQNLFWAFVYNLIGIPIAAGLLYPIWGFMLNPMIAAAAMALSSVSVVSNSLRLNAMNITGYRTQ